MRVLLLVRARQAVVAQAQVSFGDLAMECGMVLLRARRDRVPVVHFFPDWPPGTPQLPGCAPVREECVVSDLPALDEALRRCGQDQLADAPRKLLASGMCDAASYRGLIEITRQQKIAFELVPAAFKFLPSGPAVTTR